MSLTVALSKGKLFTGTQSAFRQGGLPFPEDVGRKLVVDVEGFRFLFVKDADVPVYVEYGAADCGIAGRDVILESGSDVYEPLDLGFGRCALAVAAPKAAAFDYRRAATVRVASKYPKVATAFFRERGIQVDVVKLAGSVELGAVLGLADCIVDVVETGRTLVENGLVVVEEVAPSSARLIVNRASYHARRGEVARLLNALRRSRA